MSRAMKIIPWSLSALSMFAVLAIWMTYQQQLEQKDAELASLREQHNKLIAEANTKVEQANVILKKVTDDANQKLQLANQREVAAKVSFRKAMLSNGNVVGITNTSAETISLIAEIERRASGQKRSYDLVIDPGKSKEIGEREGWAFTPGDTIKLSQANHKSLIFTAP